MIIQQKKETGPAQKSGILFAVFGAVVQALSLVLTKYALTSSGALTTNMIRCLGGLISLFLFSLFRKNLVHDFSSYHSSGLSLFLLLALGSLLGPIIGMSSEMQAFRFAPLGTVTAISQSSPVILLIQEGVLGRKRVSFKEAMFTLWAVGGIALLFIAD
ncbi:MAG: DMT family transporter [Sphaerochaeta sp.]|nr:DMT family transporter [Sphaerochaeta sp.]